jgi:hypothetical protein
MVRTVCLVILSCAPGEKRQQEMEVPAVYQRPPPPATLSFRLSRRVPASRRTRRALLGGVGPILGGMGMKTGSKLWRRTAFCAWAATPASLPIGNPHPVLLNPSTRTYARSKASPERSIMPSHPTRCATWWAFSKPLARRAPPNSAAGVHPSSS